eukprot:TRINITY_DN24309_c0_g1_i1.p1 TRINITY_DN24309_c0_g1~~TRINITY_DN24309_c0_g1_i1.p1  ORF type:complete len:353 (+),score=24.23 TRINITY_DN24309_c0_g1_i1:57-1061(+)
MLTIILLLAEMTVSTAPGPTSGASLTQEWLYSNVPGRGPSSWPVNYPHCGEDDQSPVDIRALDALQDSGLKALDTKYPEESKGYSVTHSQTSVSVKFGITTGEISLVDPNAQNHQYAVSEINVKVPAEHSISGLSMDLEIQIVHTSTVVGSNQKLVISLLFEEGGGRHTWLSEFIELIPAAPLPHLDHYDNPNLSFKESAKELIQKSFKITELLPGRRDFFTYEGSETSPPCGGNVTWYVMSTVGRVSAAQVHELEAALLIPQEKELLKTRFGDTSYLGPSRPLQSLNSRTIRSFTDIGGPFDRTDKDRVRLGTIGTVIGISTFLGVVLNLLFT